MATTAGLVMPAVRTSCAVCWATIGKRDLAAEVRAEPPQIAVSPYVCLDCANAIAAVVNVSPETEHKEQAPCETTDPTVMSTAPKRRPKPPT